MMNKNQFLTELQRRLRGVPQEELDQAMEYYTEYFLDANVDDVTDVIPLVGTPEQVAQRIWDECVDKQVTIQRQEGGVKNTAKTVWLIVLAVFAAPIALPVAIAVAAVVFAVLVVIFAVIFSIIVAAVALVIGGFAALPGVFWVVGIGQAFIVAGSALVMIGIGLLLILAFWKLGTWCILQLAQWVRKLGEKKRGVQV